jgi:threonine efflux protein
MLATLLTITALHWVVLVTPGVNLMLVSQLAASGQRRNALVASLGITAVTLTWALLALFGVSAVFAAHPQLRQTLQVAGGLYLCYVAVKLWRAGAPAEGMHTGKLGAWAAFRLGFFTNIMNPKSALFFGSVFATALPADASAGLLAAAVAMVYVNALIWHLALALGFSHPSVRAVYENQRRHLNRLAGAIVGAFGLRLLVATAQEMRTR